ncbi:hypothetical protein Q8W71_23895 [Methylobacterium sp. NEAU 140]|uniref:hypothetical protein n=1 Tax=Methylobacterium sp. NEAU 140 TaxID=3064945 RepID=UPI0027343366|nr:hypothetical protein [Methylobacterium sp. NEAU 140]MDP4025682.1 hypothetical protein [Methylobacterium sp. NEAU 140]
MRAARPDTFLDTTGAGTLAVPPARSATRPSTSLAAVTPVLATLAALAVVAATGLSRRSGLPEAVEPLAYGFFLDRYPLFAFALVYGIARLVAVAAGPGPASIPRRAAFCALGIVVLGLAGLYPTFGGAVLRGGFATGSMAFLNGTPLWLAYGMGAGVAAALFGGTVGVFAVAANRGLRPRLARLWPAALAFLALWFGAAVLGLARGLGFGPWPARAMTPAEAGLAAGLLVLAALPHAALRGRRDPR